MAEQGETKDFVPGGGLSDFVPGDTARPGPASRDPRLSYEPVPPAGALSASRAGGEATAHYTTAVPSSGPAVPALKAEAASAPGRPPVSSRYAFQRRLTLFPLVMVMFFAVAGGAYGLEPAIGEAGGLGLVMLVVAPLLWTLPVAWAIGELAAAIPAEGGYYVWVQRGLGRFWGFQEGWWSWTNAFVDMAIYPVLFANYLGKLLDSGLGFSLISDNALAHWGVCLVMIWMMVLLNVRGVRLVGYASMVFGVIVLAPLAVMTIIGLQKWAAAPTAIWQPLIPEGTSWSSAMGLGLFVVMWNYLGWDGPSTVAGEVERPARTYNRAMVLAITLVICSYVLPVAAGLAVVPPSNVWQDGAFPDIAKSVGGSALSTAVAVGGVVSAAGLFSALLLANSRLPMVLAADGFLPTAFTRLHPRFETPWLGVVITAAISSIFSLQSFSNLVELSVIVYAAGLLLEFAALIALRRREPELPRPVRVPGGAAGLTLVTLAPVAVLAAALTGTALEEGPEVIIAAVAIIISGPVLYPLLNKRNTAH